jgi:hypothetical protein
MGVTVLDREMFTEAEAARLLRVSQNTLNYWLEGGEYRGRRYRPVIREQARGSRAPVTCGMSKPAKPAAVHYYADADILAWLRSWSRSGGT